jgi:2-oxoglutarate dehydrogenase E2 component (dihydrolipoamide succinyltransferase)
MNSTLDIHAPSEQTEGTRSQVLRWLKAIGDAVAEHEPLIEIETDKVTVEVASPATGVLREIVKGEQEEIAPGDILGRIEVPAGATGRSAADPSLRARESGVSAKGAGLSASDAGANLALGARDANVHQEPPSYGEPVASASSPRVMSPSRGIKAGGSSVANDPRTSFTSTDAATRLSPAVRRLITERGLDPATIPGSGEAGRITIDDVLAHKAAAQAPASKAAASSSPSASPPATDAQSASHSIPHTAIRKRIADHMVQSLLHTAPHVTTMFEADMSAVIAHRTRNRADFEKRGAPLTFTAYFLAAAVEAIRSVPETNSRWTDSALEIYDNIHIGIATALEAGGLVVPVLRNVESRTLFDIAQGLRNLVTAAREGNLQPAEVRGGTFTISNHGVSGSLLAAPIIINQPQSAILGVGKLEKRAVIVAQNGEDRIVIQPKCYVTLTIDHRVMDGHQANRFLQTFVRTLEAWPAQ